jgi:phenylpropionate dioxygenase-like ring-hydroxylating dioxygenase large terminal subunit
VVDADTIYNEWFPVAIADTLEPGSFTAFGLLDRRYLLLCDRDGTVLATEDTCPHRGAQLSLGSFDGARLQCAYHGWEFDTAGRCVHQPAHPDRTPPATSSLVPITTRERYGLWWVCVGDEPRNLPSFPAYDAHPGLSLLLEPAVVESSGPRIVENFLDLAHFPYIHAGYLGEVPHTTVERYGVDVIAGELLLSNVTVWQPHPGPRATRGGPVAYDYSVSHPYAAALTKIPSEHDGGDIAGFSILLVTSPVNETACRVFRVVTVRDPDVDVDAQRAFNRTIFEQDIPIVESQLPKRLPLDVRAEVHQPADAGSLAYRKWLIERGTMYGTGRSATTKGN